MYPLYKDLSIHVLLFYCGTQASSCANIGNRQIYHTQERKNVRKKAKRQNSWDKIKVKRPDQKWKHSDILQKNKGRVICKLNKIEEHKAKRQICALPGQPQQNISSCYSETDSLTPRQILLLVSSYLLLFLIQFRVPPRKRGKKSKPEYGCSFIYICKKLLCTYPCALL